MPDIFCSRGRRGARHPRDRPRSDRQCRGRRWRAPPPCLVDHAGAAHGDAACLCRGVRDGDRIVRAVKARLKERFGLDHTTVEIERGECADALPKRRLLRDDRWQERNQPPSLHRRPNRLLSRSRICPSILARAIASPMRSNTCPSTSARPRPWRWSASSGSGKTVTALSFLRLLPYPAASHPSGAIRFKGKDLLELAPPAFGMSAATRSP